MYLSFRSIRVAHSESNHYRSGTTKNSSTISNSHNTQEQVVIGTQVINHYTCQKTSCTPRQTKNVVCCQPQNSSHCLNCTNNPTIRGEKWVDILPTSQIKDHRWTECVKDQVRIQWNWFFFLEPLDTIVRDATSDIPTSGATQIIDVAGSMSIDSECPHSVESWRDIHQRESGKTDPQPFKSSASRRRSIYSQKTISKFVPHSVHY